MRARETGTGSRTRRDGRRGERGALLVDALIAMLFFGTILAAWAALVKAETRSATEADRRFRAVCAAESAMAEVRDGMRVAGEFPVAGAGALKGAVTLTPRPDGWRDCEVRISWRLQGRDGGEESLKLTSIVRP